MPLTNPKGGETREKAEPDDDLIFARPRQKGAGPNIWQMVEENRSIRREREQELRGDRVMPLADAKALSFHFEEGKYIVECAGFEDIPASEEHPDWGAQVRWLFDVYDIEGDPVLDDEGEHAQLRPYGGVSLGPKSKTSRLWAEALIGRGIEVGDKGADIQAECLGKRASAMIGDNDKGFSSLLKLTAIKKKPAAKTKDEDEE